jgi:galactose mutarotase-like enzyme
MGELIALARDGVEANIDLQGAWLTRLQVVGKDVLFPRRSIILPDGSTKVRGGSHVCFPNFGPGGASGLPQHGFARTSVWKTLEQSAFRVELDLDASGSGYANVEVRLTYELLDNGICMALRVRNGGDAALPLCPAFHPYYASSTTQSVVDGVRFSHAGLAEAKFLDGPVSKLDTGDIQFELRQQNLPQWVLWTDSLGGYVCLEPTAGGNGFEDGKPLQLEADGTWHSSLTIRTTGKKEL